MKILTLFLVLPTFLFLISSFSNANAKTHAEYQAEMEKIEGLTCWKMIKQPNYETTQSSLYDIFVSYTAHPGGEARGLLDDYMKFIDDTNHLSLEERTLLEQKLSGKVNQDAMEILHDYSEKYYEYKRQADIYIQHFQKLLRDQNIVLNVNKWSGSLGSFYCDPSKNYAYKIKLNDHSIELTMFHTDTIWLFRNYAEFVFEFDKDSSGSELDLDAAVFDAMTTEGLISEAKKGSPIIHLITILKLAGLKNSLPIDLERYDRKRTRESGGEGRKTDYGLILRNGP